LFPRATSPQGEKNTGSASSRKQPQIHRGGAGTKKKQTHRPRGIRGGRPSPPQLRRRGRPWPGACRGARGHTIRDNDHRGPQKLHTGLTDPEKTPRRVWHRNESDGPLVFDRGGRRGDRPPRVRIRRIFLILGGNPGPAGHIGLGSIASNFPTRRLRPGKSKRISLWSRSVWGPNLSFPGGGERNKPPNFFNGSPRGGTGRDTTPASRWGHPFKSFCHTA